MKIPRKMRLWQQLNFNMPGTANQLDIELARTNRARYMHTFALDTEQETLRSNKNTVREALDGIRRKHIQAIVVPNSKPYFWAEACVDEHASLNVFAGGWMKTYTPETVEILITLPKQNFEHRIITGQTEMSIHDIWDEVIRFYHCQNLPSFWQ